MYKIRCTSCNDEIEITAALQKDIEQKLIDDIEDKHKSEIDKIEHAHKIQQQEEKQRIILETERQFKQELDLQSKQFEEEQKRNNDLIEKQFELTQKLRESKNAEQKIKLEYQQKIIEEEQKIKEQAKKEATDELNLKMLEKDKKIQDAQNQILELQRKIQQGSQQTQGEVLELEIEKRLQDYFKYDVIEEIGKGVTGADIIQAVRTIEGLNCGTIIWEIKNTKNFNKNWIQKLIDDKRIKKADIAVLVTTVLPDGIESFGYKQGVWICDIKSYLALSVSLRQQLIGVRKLIQANQGKVGKAEQVYNYLISNEFQQRVEVIVEYIINRRSEIDKERRAFIKKWEKEEKSLFSLLQGTAGIYGDINGIIGNALPKVKNLELE